MYLVRALASLSWAVDASVRLRPAAAPGPGCAWLTGSERAGPVCAYTVGSNETLAPGLRCLSLLQQVTTSSAFGAGGESVSLLFQQLERSPRSSARGLAPPRPLLPSSQLLRSPSCLPRVRTLVLPQGPQTIHPHPPTSRSFMRSHRPKATRSQVLGTGTCTSLGPVFCLPRAVGATALTYWNPYSNAVRDCSVHFTDEGLRPREVRQLHRGPHCPAPEPELLPLAGFLGLR